ncbi:Acidic repeat-containing protein [Eumeta japonica]|uniref:Acidic repeat-containing protein n=1 Tax=Eumeta variegata TaxID=151549 RepID=A0A4C1Z1Z2_EUMVA|nr:Acidic repeat-containing protein [Eumeta japonica]
MVAWPSGLRRWFKAPVSSEAWVRIPPLPRFFFPFNFSERFLKLSLKKNRLNTNNGGKESELDSNVIILDESFDCLMYDKVNALKQKWQWAGHVSRCKDSRWTIKTTIWQGPLGKRNVSRPAKRWADDIIKIAGRAWINLAKDREIWKEKEEALPKRDPHIIKTTNEDELPPVQLKTNTRPSDVSFWSPAQNIICATPKYQITPSTPRDVANESFNECSMKKIEDSQKKLLNDLYGEVWKTMPSLFKTQKLDYDTNIIKKLDFSDGMLKVASPIQKENLKKKLYTEKVPNTPEPINDINKKFKREVQTTSKKARTKTVTELVQDLKSEYTADSSRNPKKDIDYISHKIDNVPSWRCNNEALKYKENYKSKREELTRRLYKDFNELVFSNNLDEDMPIIWDTRLRSSAGITINRVVKTSKGIKVCSSTIKLSTKILDGPQRLRDTLIHEMCHAATWIVDKELKAGHGPLWKKW